MLTRNEVVLKSSTRTAMKEPRQKKKNISQMSFRALHLKEKNKPGP